MIQLIARRVLLTIPVLLGVATLVFSLIHLVPGDPAQAMLGEGASPQDVQELRARLGLDRPLLAQYSTFMKGLARADLGELVAVAGAQRDLIGQAALLQQPLKLGVDPRRPILRAMRAVADVYSVAGGGGEH